MRIFTEDANRIILQQLLPEAILTTYEGTKSLIELLSEAIGWASVIVAGPTTDLAETSSLTFILAQLMLFVNIIFCVFYFLICYGGNNRRQ